MGMDCGGDFVILENGVKDCSHCIKPHDPVFVEEYLKSKLRTSDD
jgi:Zn-finger protein